MEQQSGGDHAAKRAKVSSSADAGEDRISALPDDVLVLILLRVSTSTAARTSVLSRRWRYVWTLLPVLRFPYFPSPHRFRDALAASEVPLRNLLVADQDATAGHLGTWLPAAARRASGLFAVFNTDFRISASEEEKIGAQRGALTMPCFEKATSIWLCLGFLGLVLEPAGTFARLTRLYLSRIRFVGPCELGDMVSSPRCPSLRKLSISESRGVDKLAIHSESIVEIELKKITELQQLTMVASALQELHVTCCFIDAPSQPVANISAPQLVLLDWSDYYDPNFMDLGNMASVQHLGNLTYFVLGQESHDDSFNDSCLSLLQRFKVVESLTLTLAYILQIDSFQYLMENMTVLPDLTFLYLNIIANGHAFGASSFHVLKMCNGLRRLALAFCDLSELEGHLPCTTDCICFLPSNWETEELMLNHLQEIEIYELRGSDHEVAFMERLFRWATVLKKMTVTFNSLITECKAEELFHMFQNFSRRGVCMKFYICQNFDKVPYAPKDRHQIVTLQHSS